MIVGISWRSAPLPVRERFWISPGQRRAALAELTASEGIEEAAILANCERTELILWAPDASLAAESVLSFFTRAYALRSAEWRYFYRLVDEHAMAHVLQVACGLDSMTPGDPQALSDLKSAWGDGQAAGTCGASLDAVFEKAFSVAAHPRPEVLPGSNLSLPLAAVELAKQIFGSLEKRRALVLGAGRVAEHVIRTLATAGANVRILSRTQESAAQLAGVLGVSFSPMRDLGTHLTQADVVIGAAATAEFIVKSAELESAAHDRSGKPLLLIDLGLPRNIDPVVREIADVFLYDLEGIPPLLARAAGEQVHPAEQEQRARAEAVIACEAREFCSKLESQRAMPPVVSLRQRVDEICRQEMELFRHDGSSPDGQALEEFAYRISRRLARSLAREIKEHPAERDQLSTLAERLFRLEMQPPAAGAK